MKKRTHWFVAAGLALCGLLLAALTLEGRTGPGKARVLRRKRMKYAF